MSKRTRMVMPTIAVVATVGAGAFLASVRAQPVGPGSTAFAHVETIGTTDLPWPRSNAFLNQPVAVAGDRDGVWVANAGGRNVIRFGTGPLEELGRAGSLTRLYGLPARWIADVAVQYAPRPLGSPPTPVPTPDPGAGPELPPSRVIWLADSGAHVVVGIPINSYGLPGTPIILGEHGVPGSGADHFDSPGGVTVDAFGHLYVSDTGNHRVQVFGPDRALVATIGESGRSGSDNGHFDRPGRIDADKEGRLFITDPGNRRVQAFNIANPAAPRYVATYGAGGGPLGLADPTGVGTDASFVYVADGSSGRVVIYEKGDGDHWRTLDGRTNATCGYPDPAAWWTAVSDVSLTSAGTIAVVLRDRMQVALCDAFTRAPISGYGSAGAPYVAEPGHLNAPAAAAEFADGFVVVAERDGHRLVARAADGSEPWRFGTAGVAGGDDNLSSPSDMAILPGNQIVVADSGNSRLVVVDRLGRRTAVWGEGSLGSPKGLTVVDGGRIAVADGALGQVVLFDASGRPDGVLQNAAGQPLAFADPVDVARDAAGGWYVSEASAHVVRRFDATGAPLAPIGEAGVSGAAFDRLNSPHGLAVDPDGRLYVADTGNNRVQVFAADGSYLTTMGGVSGGGTGGMIEPRGVAVGIEGRVLVADTFNHRVQVFRPARPPWEAWAINGFGDRDADAVTALIDHDGWLFAGTDGRGGAAMWQRAGTGPWYESASGGFGDAGEHAVSALAVHGGDLFAATENRIVAVDPASGARTVTTQGGDVWRSVDTGSSWERVAEAGFGSTTNAAASSLASFRGHLYAGTRTGTDAGGNRGAAQLWRSDTGASGSWRRISIELFTRDDWTRNGSIQALAAYSNTLIAGTCAQGGPQIWASADGSAWRPAGDLEVGGDPRDATPLLGPTDVACVTDFAEFKGQLYAALGNEPRESGRFWSSGPAAVWRCTVCNGTDWEPAAAPGMGDLTSTGRAALAAHSEPPFEYLYAALGNQTGGMQLWRSPDGADWEPLLVDGFGDDNNADVGGGAALATHGGRIHVGTRNLAHGGELWSSAGGRPGIVPTPPGATPSPTPRPLPQPPVGRARYEKVAEWPTGAIAAANVLGAPVDMAVGSDASVYILDSEPVRVLRVSATGAWLAPFGGTGSGPDRITRTSDNGLTAAIEVDVTANRVYVSDLGTERILLYDLDGRYQGSWDEIVAVDLSLRADGSLWVADILAGAVRRLDRSGREVERIGAFAPDDDTGMLRMVQVVEDTGGRLWVADLNGNRLRVYENSGGAWRRIRNMDMTSGARQGCGAGRLQALGDDMVLAGICVIEESRVIARVPFNHLGSDLYGATLRTANLSGGHYFALATYDIDRFNPDNPTYPTVVRYFDNGFDIVSGQYRGVAFSAAAASDGAILNPARISTAPDGSLFISDNLGLRRFSPEGRVMDELGIQAYPSRSYNVDFEPRLMMGTGERGKVFGVALASTGRRQIPSQLVIYGDTVQRRRCVARQCVDGLYVEPVWDAVLEAGLRRVPIVEYNYAVAHEPTKNQLVLLQLWVENPSPIEFPARLLLFPAGQMGRKTEVALNGSDRQALWTDVDAGRDGRILVLDTLRDLVQVVDADGRLQGQVPTPKDAWRVAAGPNQEIYVLTTYGHVVRMAADGTELSRFVGLPNNAAPFTAQVDLAVDDAGRVFVADDLYQQITVFEASGSENDVLEGGRCTVAGDKWVDPTDIQLGDEARLFLTLFGSCGYEEEPADIVIAVNAAPSVDIENLQVARQIVGLVDLDVHRVGVVSYVLSSIVDAPLTHDRNRLILALYSVNSPRITGCGVNTQSALRAAEDVFEDAPGRRKVLIILDPPMDPVPGRGCPFDQVSLAAASQRLRAAGVLIVAVNGPLNPTTLAASSEPLGRVQVAPRGQGVGRPALRRSVTRTWPDSLVATGVLTDTLPANIDYVDGSAAPPAAWNAVNRTLTWQLNGLARTEAHRFELSIRPRQEGLWPTNVEAYADTVDGWGRQSRTVLPVPKIRVYGEIPPTQTPFPIQTPGPSPTPRPNEPLYLPVILNTEPCSPFTRNADVALVLDTSGSMSDVTSSGGETKFEAARGAARAFLQNLVAGRDQAAVVQFNTAAEVVVALSDDPVTVSAGLDRLTQASGTRIDLALEVATAELLGPGRRAGNNPVLILLTDGEPTGTTREEVLAKAAAAKSGGILVFTVGLGQEIDHELMRGVASQLDWYFPAPDTSDLLSIYERIAYSIPCVPQWP